LNIPVPRLVSTKEAQKKSTPQLAEQAKGSGKMGKTLLIFLAVVFMAPMLSGCFYYPHRDDGYGRGYGHGRGYYDDRYYDRNRDGYRDYYRERR
jgi:hypothetical protein